MKYLDQSANSIRLFLVSGNPDIEQFILLGKNSFVWNDGTVTFGILGESHFLTIEKNGERFTEICACTSAIFDSTQSELLTSGFLTEMDNLPLSKEWGNMKYTFNYKFFDYKRGMEFLSDLQKTQKDDTQSLQYAFPARFFFMRKPVTEIFIKTQSDCLHIRTVHTYPNHNQAVFTDSVIRLQG